MGNSINIQVVLDDKGGLKKVTSDAKQAGRAVDGLAGSTEKLNNSRNKNFTLEKGTSQSTNNSTRAFSKQAKTIGGSSGLVAAYATLAANVFAITAAFGVLKRTASFEQLQQGLIITGEAAGQNLPLVAKELKNITDNAISTEAAMRAVAVGTSAGFDQSQLEGLTQVAKGASLALGRDMTDALDRLVRGTAKLEPEILDELGIMVRLDDVTEKYAASVGKAASDVSVFEKRMAFANAVIDQGTKKFALLADEMDPNPYDQLQSTFDSLIKTLVTGLNTVLGPIIGAFSANAGILAGTLLLVGTNVAKTMVPALTSSAEKLAENAVAARDFSDSQKLTLGTLGKTNKKYNAYIDAVQQGTDTEEMRLDALKGLNASERRRAKDLEELKDLEGNRTATYKLQAEQLEEVRRAQRVLNGTSKESFAAASAEAKANAVNNASKLKLRATINSLTAAYRNEIAAKTTSATTSNLLTSANARLSASLAVVGTAARAAGVAFLTLLPYLGLITVAISGAIALFKKFFQEPPSALDEAVEKSKERFEGFPEVISRASKAYKLATDNASRFNAVLKPTAGLIGQLSDQVEEFFIAQETAALRATFKLEAELDRLKAQQKEAQNVIKNTKVPKISTNEFDGLIPSIAVKNAERNLIILDSKISDVNKKLSEIKVINLEDTIAAIKTSITVTTRSITKLQELGKSGKDTQEEIDVLGVRINKLNELLNKLNSSTTEKELQDIRTELLKLSIGTKELENTVKGTSEAIDDLTGHVRTQNDSFGPYAETLKKAKAVLAGIPEEAKGITAITEQMKAGFEALGASSVSEFEEIINSIEQLNSSYANLKVVEAAISLETSRLSQLGQEVSAIDTQVGLIEYKLGLERQALDQAINNTKNLDAENTARANINKLEEERLKLQLKRIKAEFAEKTGDPSALKQIELQGNASNLGAIQGAASAAATAQLALEQEKLATAKAYQEAVKNTAEAKKADLEVARQVLATEKARINAEIVQPGKFGGAIGQAGADTSGAIASASNVLSGDGDLSTKISAAAGAVSPMVEQLKQLGPDGDILSATIEGAFLMSEAFSMAFEKMSSDAGKLEKASAVIGGLQAGISAISAIQADQTRQAVAGIDKQIAAEKKRDGKSKESQQKLAALEKKKEQLQKKAFEQDKKMKSAQVVMATALGIMQVIAQGGFVGIAMSALVAALGAAQLAAINSSSFEGGGSAGSASTPRGPISVGERNNRVDFSKSQSAAGELSFVRGESGVGTANNFRPAFTGARYRAAGGSAGFIVGEQGPELFIPEVPGQIVSNSDAGSSNSNTTLNFHVSAIDAAGVEEMLSGQRGNIIRMIREQANDAGETFLEGLDERF